MSSASTGSAKAEEPDRGSERGGGDGAGGGESGPASGKQAKSDGQVTKLLFLIRHAQGVHNYAAGVHGVEAYKKWEYEDARCACVCCGGELGRAARLTLVLPRLDATGEAQAARLQAEFAKSGVKLDVVLCSPLTRTLQTATISFKHSRVPIVVVEALREAYGAHPCDRRRPRAVLEKEFPSVDMRYLAAGEDSLWTKVRETYVLGWTRWLAWFAGGPGADVSLVRRASYPSVVKRASAFVDFLQQLPAETKNVAVVTHGVFLDCLLKYCLTVPDDFDQSHFGNAEVRALRVVLDAPARAPAAAAK